MIRIEEVYTFGWESAIRNHENFKCNQSGEIIGKRGKPLKGMIDRCGYREVCLSENGKTKSYLVHRLILSTFKPIENMDRFDVNHKNGIKTDNRLENLEWCTRSENVLHAYRIGLEKKCVGENHHAHKLTKEDVSYIKSNYKKRDREYGAVALSKKFKVDRTTIHDIVRGKTWKEN